MTTTKQRLAVLEKRAAYLEARVAASQEKDLSYDKAEAAALRWAIGKLKEYLARTRQKGDSE